MSTQHEGDRDAPADADSDRAGHEDGSRCPTRPRSLPTTGTRPSAGSTSGPSAPPIPSAADEEGAHAGDPAVATVVPTDAPHREGEPEPVDAGLWPREYKPPPSPAYAPGGPPSPQFTRSTPAPRPAAPTPASPPTPPPPPPPPDAGLRAAPVSRGRQRAGQLLFAGLALAVAALASVTLLMIDGDDGPQTVALGEVGAAGAGATVRSGAASRPLEAGEQIVAGDVVQAASAGAVTVDLEGGGVVRFDTGASVTFIDDAIDAETGERDGDSEPALQILAGRAWVNPADGTTIEVRLPGGRATTVANPWRSSAPATAPCTPRRRGSTSTATAAATPRRSRPRS